MSNRDAYLLRTYGITQADYEMLVERQAGRCPVCWKIPKTPLVVDHDHKTGIIRGLLCRMCNYKVIGRHRVETLSAAVEYLLHPPAVAALGERRVPDKPKRRKRRRNKPSEKGVEEE